MLDEKLVFITGGGELASAIAIYLRKAKLNPVMVLSEGELHLRRPICFSEAAFSGNKQVENIQANLIKPEDVEKSGPEDLAVRWQKAIRFHIRDRSIPVFPGKELPNFQEIFKPDVIVRTSADPEIEISLENAKLVIGISPLHHPGIDCQIAVESGKNYRVGEVLLRENQNLPRLDFHFFKDPFCEIISPLEGVFISLKDIGEKIRQNEAIGKVNDVEIRSPYQGQIWGLQHSGKIIRSKQPLALIYEGHSGTEYLQFDFTHRAVAGTVLAEVANVLL